MKSSLAATIVLAGVLSTGTVATASAAKFELTSPDIKPNSTVTTKYVFNGFGCTGENVSPALSWSGAPEGTKSFAVTLYDPDAPTGSGWWHWVVFNIPPTVTSLPEGAGVVGKEPAGAVQSNTDFGKPGFGGACPPQGDKPHRYIFTVYAVKTEKLDIPPTATAATVGFMLHFNTLAKASFTARYGR